MAPSSRVLHQAKLLGGVIFMQSTYAGLAMITMFALKEGMSHYVFVVYRMAVAFAIIAPFALFFDRKKRPKLTFPVVLKIALLSLFDPVLDQNLYYIGMKYTNATFTSAMCNMLPVFAFLMAWIFRLEKVDLRRIPSIAKLLGTIVTVSGAMFMTLVRGPVLDLPWTRRESNFHSSDSETDNNIVKGAIAIAVSCFCWSCFIILQAQTLKSYPSELSLTALICFFGLVESAVLALAVEGRNGVAWSIQIDMKSLAAVYGGILSGLGYYIVGVVIKEKGPVFYSAFNPLTTILVAVLASVIIAEKMHIGRVIGAAIIIVGLYLVLWGKSKDKTMSSSLRDDVEASNGEAEETEVK